mmetsp:Transcript_2662/g.2784  ORF Transcript_2662/g.2784 Transcript_2662/m.2784 type:complete len:216 (-) Transcript_2662:655-1302(-)
MVATSEVLAVEGPLRAVALMDVFEVALVITAAVTLVAEVSLVATRAVAVAFDRSNFASADFSKFLCFTISTCFTSCIFNRLIMKVSITAISCRSSSLLCFLKISSDCVLESSSVAFQAFLPPVASLWYPLTFSSSFSSPSFSSLNDASFRPFSSCFSFKSNDSIALFNDLLHVFQSSSKEAARATFTFIPPKSPFILESPFNLPTIGKTFSSLNP